MEHSVLRATLAYVHLTIIAKQLTNMRLFFMKLSIENEESVWSSLKTNRIEHEGQHDTKVKVLSCLTEDPVLGALAENVWWR